MIIRSHFLIAASLVVLTLSGCDKLQSSVSENKLTAQPLQEAEGRAERAAAPDAASIAQELAAGNYDKAANAAKSAIDLDPQDPELQLLLARAHARLQNVGEAIKALQASFDAGFHDPRGALNNPDFDDIRNNSLFVEFESRFQRKQVPNSRSSRSSYGADIRAGGVSIHERQDGHARIRAGDVVIDD